MQQGNFINVFLARHVSGTYAHHQEHQTLSCGIWFSASSFWMGCTAPSASYTRPTQRLSRTPPIQKLGAGNHMLQLDVWCSWWWAYIPETCRAKNTLIKLPCCIKLAFQIITCLIVVFLCILITNTNPISHELQMIRNLTKFNFFVHWVNEIQYFLKNKFVMLSNTPWPHTNKILLCYILHFLNIHFVIVAPSKHNLRSCFVRDFPTKIVYHLLFLPLVLDLV